MTDDDHETPIAIRLNIIGSLQIERGGKSLPPPEAKAAHHLLALLAVKDKAGNQELVNFLWPGDSLADVQQSKSVRARLDRAFTDARAAVGVRADSGLLARHNGIAHRVRGDQVTITTDLDDFNRLRDSEDADDWRVALALVRGPIAQHVPTDNMDADWLEGPQRALKGHIETLLKKLTGNTDTEAIQQQAQDVLDGHWSGAAETSRSPESPASPETTVESGSDGAVSFPAPRGSSVRRWVAKRYVVAGVVATLLLITGGFLLVRSGGGTSIPPEGSVVDAETGAIVAHPKVIASPLPARLEFGSEIFRACDLSAESCGSGYHGPAPLKVKVGDIVAFKVTLNAIEGAIHYLKLEAFSQPRLLNPTQVMPRVSQTELEIHLSIIWPEALGAHEVVNEPNFVHNHPENEEPLGNSFYLQLPHPGHYSLDYITGSTTLVNKETHFFHYLPDGIMRLGYGIELENVGPPLSCFWCSQRYIRYVYFHARVTKTSKYIFPPFR